MKSQVSAPIELFVAVIILAFTLAIGLNVIGNVEEGKCISTLKAQTQNLKNAMVDVALGSAGTKRQITFEFPKCGSTDVVALQFVLYTDPKYCRLCPSSYGYCWQVVPLAKDPNAPGKYVQIVDGISCVNMAGDVAISQSSATACPSGVGLSDTPCPTGTNCNPDTIGLTKGVWDASKVNTPSGDANPSRWKTFSADKSRFYSITLTKTLSLQGSGGEKGAIEVCATKIGG